MLSDELPYRAIGKVVSTIDGTWKTGYLVGEDLVATTASALIDDQGKPRPGLVFFPNVKDGRTRLVSQILGWWPGTPGSRTDYGVARIASPLGKRLGYFEVMAEPLDNFLKSKSPGKLRVAGYGPDAFGGQTAFVDDRISITENGGEVGWRHDGHSYGGAGGPIFVFGDRGSVYAVATDRGLSPDRSSELAVPADTFINLVKEHRVDDVFKSTGSTAQVCNDTPERLPLARAWEQNVTWRADGWQILQPGQCLEYRFPSGYEGIFYFRSAGPPPYEFTTGDFEFCVNDGSLAELIALKHQFLWRDAHVPCGPPGARKPFKMAQVRRNEINFIVVR
jgi:hypothetical protein